MSTKIGRPKQRICKWGHDTDLEGRRPNGTCRRCFNEWQRDYHQRVRKARIGHRDMERYGGVPAWRLRKAVTREQAAAAWAHRWNTSYPTGRRAADRLWKADRISIDAADRWCVALGTQLFILYPEAYEGIEE